MPAGARGGTLVHGCVSSLDGHRFQGRDMGQQTAVPGNRAEDGEGPCRYDAQMIASVLDPVVVVAGSAAIAVWTARAVLGVAMAALTRARR